MDKDTTKFVLTEYLNPLHHNFLRETIRKRGLDRYVKKLDTLTATKLFVFAQLMQLQSYADLSLHLKTKKNLQKVTNLSSISTAQLSRKWRDLDCSFLEQVFRHMVQRVTSRFGMAKANQLLGRLHLVDASTIILCLSRYRWAPYSKHKSAVKLHLRFVDTPEVRYPDEAVLTTGKVADHTRMDDLVHADALNVFDRGYVDYRKFDEYCETSVLFVTRLKHNADFKVMEERQVEPHSGIQRDTVIWLGYRNTRYVMKRHLRLVECLDKKGEPILLCTNDFSHSAEEIGDIYRRRWQIELFFKWMKQHFHVKRCYGTSRNAVYNQIWTALIAYCLSLLMQAGVQHKGSLFAFVKQVRLGWEKELQEVRQELFRPPSRLSKGRPKQRDVDRIYAQTCRQYANGEADYIDTLEYGSLI